MTKEQEAAARKYCASIGMDADEFVSVPCPDGRPGCYVNHLGPRWQALAMRRAADKRESDLWSQAETGAEHGSGLRLKQEPSMAHSKLLKDRAQSYASRIAPTTVLARRVYTPLDMQKYLAQAYLAGFELCWRIHGPKRRVGSAVDGGTGT